jgi:hypothetical protein
LIAMLQFASPVALVALGALIVPLALHLVRRPRRVVRLGSLRFLNSEHRQMRTLRWRDLLLLAIRCAMLALLALLLAGPRWQPRDRPSRRWLLLVPGTKLDPSADAEWQRLRAEGYEPRELAPGYVARGERASRVEAKKAGGARALSRRNVFGGETEADVDVWSMLRELDLRAPIGSRAVVFGPTWANQFRGPRPTLSNVEIRWQQVTGPPPVPDSDRIEPVRVALVADEDRAEDARYLRAAWQAIGDVVITEEAPQWIVQLGDVPLPPALVARVQRGAHLLTDAPRSAAVTRVSRSFQLGGSPIVVRQRVALERGVPLLSDSMGEPLITEEREGEGLHWRIASRFHPDWNDWPIGNAFPAWWQEQMRPAKRAPAEIAPEQAAPAFAPRREEHGPFVPGLVGIDLGWSCWVAAVLLFVLERGLSAGTRRRIVA